jgi:hypothetical protein
MARQTAPVSLRRYRAHQRYRRYRNLPVELRTPERTEPLLDAIFDYAYENVPANEIRDRVNEPGLTRQVCWRLGEFITGSEQTDTLPVMDWWHENLLPEVWLSRDHLEDFVVDCLRGV